MPNHTQSPASPTTSFPQVFEEVSDPSHVRYGEYLTLEDIARLIGPDPLRAEAIKMLLLAYGVPEEDIKVNQIG